VGTFTYDSAIKADFDDRLLAHLQLAISTKLRRGEAFNLTWRDDVRMGDGRTTVWIHPAIPLVYKFHGSRPPQINPHWVELLILDGAKSGGMHVIPEPSSTESTEGTE
jgi:integrase